MAIRILDLLILSGWLDSNQLNRAPNAACNQETLHPVEQLPGKDLNPDLLIQNQPSYH